MRRSAAAVRTSRSRARSPSRDTRPPAPRRRSRSTTRARWCSMLALEPSPTPMRPPTSMLRHLCTTALLAAAAIAQTPFTLGNLVVVRVGDGAVPLTSASAATFLDEYTPAGVLVQSLPLPTTASGTNLPLTNSGSANSEGFLTVSANGVYLLVFGYGAAPGTASIPGSTTATTPRVIGRIDLAGNIDTSTALTDAFSGGNPRSVASDDGQRFWIAGSNDFVRFVGATGSTTSLAIGTAPANNRVLNVYDNQLYGTA